MKFSIRELFLVTVIVALALGWWVDRDAMRRRLRAAEQSSLTHRKIADGYRDALDLIRSLRTSPAPDPIPPKN